MPSLSRQCLMRLFPLGQRPNSGSCQLRGCAASVEVISLDRVQESGAFGDLGRRRFLRGVAGAGAAVGVGGVLAACSSSSSSPAPQPSGVAKNQKPGGDLKVGLTGGSPKDTL